MRRRNGRTAGRTGLRPTLKLALLSLIILCSAARAVAQKAPGGTGARAAADLSRRIVISIPDRKLALIENVRVVKIYRIAVGAPETPTPEGEFTVINRLTRPTWYGADDRKPVPPGPDNPLGTRWLGLSKRGFGIHGTNAPKSIGTRASHGCIRMLKRDVEELFELVRVGDKVELRGQRTAELARIFGAPYVVDTPNGKPGAQPAPAALLAAVRVAW